MRWVDVVLKCGDISESVHTPTHTKRKGCLGTNGTMTTLVPMDMDHNHEKDGGNEKYNFAPKSNARPYM